MRLQVPLLAAAALFRPSQACFAQLAHLAPRTIEDSSPTECPGEYVPPNESVAIINAKVFDGEGFGENPQTVLLKQGLIAGIDCEVPENATIVDGAGKFLIPGLIDGHVHPADCAALGELAGWGVTTAINMNCQDYEVCAALRSQSGVADFKTASFFGVGYGSSLALLFGVPCSKTIRAHTDLAARVDDAFSNGADFFKIVAEENGPTQEQQNEIVELARSYGKFTATHAALVEYYDQAIKSTSESITHTPSDGLLSDEQISLIKSQGQFVSPTMEFYRILLGNETLRELLEMEGQYNYVEKNVQLMHEAGIPIIASTDAVGNFQGIVNFAFGETLHCELQNMAKVGLSSAEAIRSATSVAAEWYRLDDRGSIAEGLRADLVLLGSNPLEAIQNTLDVDSVWVGGVSVDNIIAKQDGACA